MEKQSEQHATTPSERTTLQEKSGLGISLSSNVDLSYRFHESNKGEYAALGHSTEQLGSVTKKPRGENGPNGQYID